jgi:hypothetical protein
LARFETKTVSDDRTGFPALWNTPGLTEARDCGLPFITHHLQAYLVFMPEKSSALLRNQKRAK